MEKGNVLAEGLLFGAIVKAERLSFNGQSSNTKVLTTKSSTTKDQSPTLYKILGTG